MWSRIRRLNTEKMSIFPIMIYRFKHNSYQNQSKFLCRYKLILLALLGKYLQGKALEYQHNLGEKKEEAFPDVKDYHTASVTKMVVLPRDKHRDQSRIQAHKQSCNKMHN